MPHFIHYDLAVHTYDKNRHRGGIRLFVTLYGSRGHSDERLLRIRTDELSGGSTHRFRISSEAIGELIRIRVRLFDDDGCDDVNWCVDRIDVVELSTGLKWSAEVRGYMAWDDPANCATAVARRHASPSTTAADQTTASARSTQP